MIGSTAFAFYLLFLYCFYSFASSASAVTQDNNKNNNNNVFNNGNGMKLGDFQRELLYIETICYSGCTDGCNENCDQNCNEACNEGCNEGCNSGCNHGCLFGSWGGFCDRSCDKSCNDACNEMCNEGCNDDCHDNCNLNCNLDCIDHYPECSNDKNELTVNWDNLLSNDYNISSIASMTDITGIVAGMQDEINASIEIVSGIDRRLGVILDVTVIADYKTVGIYPSLFEYNNMNNINEDWNDEEFGFTYVLDTNLFDDNEREYLKDCNKCENRLETSFNNVQFANYWDFTYYPSDPSELGSDDYLEYPNPNIWDLTMLNPYSDACGQVKWHHVFTIYELINECGFEWVDNSVDNTIDLKGDFYLIALSPNMLNYDSNIDKGSYLQTTIIAETATLSFHKASGLDIIDNDNNNNSNNTNGIDTYGDSTLFDSDIGFILSYFGCQIISISVATDEDTQNTIVTIVLLTNVPYWMKLDDNSIYSQLLQPTSQELREIGGIYDSLTIKEISNNITDKDCFILDSFRCWQKWQIQFEIDNSMIDVGNVPNSTEDDLIDVSSDYTFQTTYTCTLDTRDDVPDVCHNYTVSSSSPYESRIITLDTQHLNYKISNNDSNNGVDSTDINANMMFYYDSGFERLRNIKTSPLQTDETAFVSIEFELNSELQQTAYRRLQAGNNIESFEINGIYFCYGKVGNVTLMNELIDFDSNYCLEDDVNRFEIRMLFDILTDSTVFGTTIINGDSNNLFQFSFSMPNISYVAMRENNIPNLSDFYITVSVIVTLTNGQTVSINVSNQRRLIPSQSPTIIPTLMPSMLPSNNPTIIPTNIPSNLPSVEPTSDPTSQPSILPTELPSMLPSMQPSGQPSEEPSVEPSVQPSDQPTNYPSRLLSSVPTTVPVISVLQTNGSVSGSLSNNKAADNEIIDGISNTWLIGIMIIALIVLGCCLLCFIWCVYRKCNNKDDKYKGTYVNPNKNNQNNDESVGVADDIVNQIEPRGNNSPFSIEMADNNVDIPRQTSNYSDVTNCSDIGHYRSTSNLISVGEWSANASPEIGAPIENNNNNNNNVNMSTNEIVITSNGTVSNTVGLRANDDEYDSKMEQIDVNEGNLMETMDNGRIYDQGEATQSNTPNIDDIGLENDLLIDPNHQTTFGAPDPALDALLE